MDNKRRVTIQGVAGCFHDAAARAYFGSHFEGEEIETVPCDSFPEMMRLLDADASLLGIMAIENTIAGALLQNHELLRKSRAVVVGEHKTRISHVLAALPGQNIGDLTEVNSHPMALMQCEEYLRRHPNLRMVEKFDTAGSAREIAQQQLTGHAAVCGEYAAKLYGLNILERGIETNKRNKVLTILSFYDMNLSKIQSMPILGREWEYRFYVDLTFDSYVRYTQALAAVTPLISELRVLGEYRQCDNEI